MFIACTFALTNTLKFRSKLCFHLVVLAKRLVITTVSVSPKFHLSVLLWCDSLLETTWIRPFVYFLFPILYIIFSMLIHVISVFTILMPWFFIPYRLFENESREVMLLGTCVPNVLIEYKKPTKKKEEVQSQSQLRLQNRWKLTHLSLHQVRSLVVRTP